MWLHFLFSLSLLLGQDPERGPDVVPCSTTCPQLPQVPMGTGGSYLFGCAHPRAQRSACTRKARSWQEMPSCRHLPELYDSLRTVTDGGVSAGGLAFPQAAVYLRSQAEAASVATLLVCHQHCSDRGLGTKNHRLISGPVFPFLHPCDCC